MNSRIEELQHSVERLQELQSRAKEVAADAADDAATAAEKAAKAAAAANADAADKAASKAPKQPAAPARQLRPECRSRPSHRAHPVTGRTGGACATATPADQKITISVFNRPGQPFCDARRRTGAGAARPRPDTRDLIQSTVSRDAQKMIFGSIAFTVLSALFLLMLITRAFAGRATVASSAR